MVTSTPRHAAAELYGRDFPAGAVIFDEGDPGSRLYVIQSGRVRIVKRNGRRHVTLAQLGAGEFFGEMALLDRQPRSAAAVVDEPARVLELDEAAFERLVTERGEVALRILRRISNRLREANRQIRDFLSADDVCRAVALLRALSGAPGADGFRPIPAGLVGAGLAARAGAELDAETLWQRLRHDRLVREVGSQSQLAPAEVVDAFLRFAELKPRFAALGAGEIAEVGELSVEQPSRVVSELLHARLMPEGSVGRDSALAADYVTYLELKRRFEPEG
jgi:CRP/FNR family transcriptional regulator, cyclic AMP receptor protein